MPSAKAGWLLTHSGIVWEPRESPASDITIEDLCYALARINRYGGHASPICYSVAEHSLLCLAIARSWRNTWDYSKEIRLAILLHDAHEAYTGFGDICGNMKKWIPFIDTIEKIVDRKVAERFGILPTTFDDPIVKEADHAALLYEKERLFPKNNAPWPEPIGDYPRMNFNVVTYELGRHPMDVEEEYKKALEELLDS